MANALVSRLGQINQAGNADALFLKVFAGEVLVSFEQATVTKNHQTIRTIQSGKSAQFPVIGRQQAQYHTPGAEIVGDPLNQNEKVIVINDLLIADSFIAEIDEAKNHYDVRSIYSMEMGRALAFTMDQHILQTMIQAAMATANVADPGYPAGTVINSPNALTNADDLITALFDAAAALDDAYVPRMDRCAFIRPETMYLLANASNAVNIDFSGMGSIATGQVPMIAGMKIMPTPHLPNGNITGVNDVLNGTDGRQNVDARNAVAIVCHKSAVGTVKLMDLAMEMERDIRRQGTLLVAKYAMGHGVLRPEASVFIRTATP